MVVYILLIREKTESSRLIENLCVFANRSSSIDYLKELIQKDQRLRGGILKYDTDTLRNSEQLLGFNPKALTVYELPFYKINIEASFLR